ncbi:MAG TPA: methyltransferase domain-containing protein [Vicinamibacterales bacterium]|nr:methyltransferase domain-containing protein [Vicinamibacterales bacterium]
MNDRSHGEAPLACSVRRCGRPLARRDRAFICQAGHSFDIARSGYVNLLQPQDRRSPSAGDSKAVVEARVELLAAGVGKTLIDEVARRVASLGLARGAVAVDLGSGSGDALAAIGSRLEVTGVGIDVSAAAVEHAARCFPTLTWVAANADRRLPLLDRSVDVAISIHGRRNPREAARVLGTGGCLIVVLPAPDDLIELRAIVQGEGSIRERTERMLAEHDPFFAPAERASIRETLEVDRRSLLNLLRITYRGARASAAERVKSLQAMRITFSSDLFVLRLRRV